MNAITVENLDLIIGDSTLIKDINFTLLENKICAILGPSGCGKTTFMNYLAGFTPILNGKINMLGIPVVPDNISIIRSKLSIMFQQGGLIRTLTILENLCFPIQYHADLKLNWIKSWALELLEMVGLSNNAHNYPHELSGGMLKRAAIARSMVLEPEILFLDEPSAGLDPITLNQIDNLIVNLRDSLNVTILIVTHNIESVFRICDELILFDQENKKVVENGNPHIIVKKTNNNWAKSFLLQYENKL